MANIVLWARLSAFYSGLVRLWAFVRNTIDRHHTLFFATVFYGVVRLGIIFASMFWTSIYRFIVLTRQAVQSVSNDAGGISSLSTFGLVNTIFPCYELFVFLTTVLAVKSVAMWYAFIRGVYKSIPLKAT